MERAQCFRSSTAALGEGWCEQLRIGTPLLSKPFTTCSLQAVAFDCPLQNPARCTQAQEPLCFCKGSAVPILLMDTGLARAFSPAVLRADCSNSISENKSDSEVHSLPCFLLVVKVYHGSCMCLSLIWLFLIHLDVLQDPH